MIKFQQSQALTSHFESFWSIVPKMNMYLYVFGYVMGVLWCSYYISIPFLWSLTKRKKISDISKNVPVFLYWLLKNTTIRNSITNMKHVWFSFIKNPAIWKTIWFIHYMLHFFTLCNVFSFCIFTQNTFRVASIIIRLNASYT